jgi:hypothetical protein
MAIHTHGTDPLWVNFMGFGKGGHKICAKLTSLRLYYIVINFSTLIARKSDETLTRILISKYDNSIQKFITFSQSIYNSLFSGWPSTYYAGANTLL